MTGLIWALFVIAPGEVVVEDEAPHAPAPIEEAPAEDPRPVEADSNAPASDAAPAENAPVEHATIETGTPKADDDALDAHVSPTTTAFIGGGIAAVGALLSVAPLVLAIGVLSTTVLSTFPETVGILVPLEVGIVSIAALPLLSLAAPVLLVTTMTALAVLFDLDWRVAFATILVGALTSVVGALIGGVFGATPFGGAPAWAIMSVPSTVFGERFPANIVEDGNILLLALLGPPLLATAVGSIALTPIAAAGAAFGAAEWVEE